jgi:hypothetical protein
MKFTRVLLSLLLVEKSRGVLYLHALQVCQAEVDAEWSLQRRLVDYATCSQN